MYKNKFCNLKFLTVPITPLKLIKYYLLGSGLSIILEIKSK